VVDVNLTAIRRRFLWLVKNSLNRVTTRLARSGHGPFSLVRHVGRKSGRTYETPLILAVVPEGFIAELTYGEKVDWYRNVVAADGCVILHRRKEYRVTHIEPCSAERGRSAFPTPLRQLLKVMRRTDFRLLRSSPR
jgi:deazaflavin-dependent oxidoreductase (nitroreductase family)